MSVSRTTSAMPLDIPDRIEHLPLTRILWKVVFLAGFAWFIESLDIGVLGVALDPIKQVLQLSPSSVGILTASSTFGIVLGLIPAGFVADKIGRKRMLVWGIVEYSVMTLLCAFAPNYALLLLFRFLSGLGMGAVFPLPYAIVSEFVRSTQRTLSNGLMDAFLSIGYFIAPLLGLIVLPNFSASLGWRVFFVVSALPLLYAFVIQRYLPESPRWLANKGLVDEAYAVISSLDHPGKQTDNQASRSIPHSSETLVEEPPKRSSVVTPWTRPFIARTISRSFAATGTFFMFYIVMTYMPSIFKSNGFSFAHSLLFTAIVTGAAIPGKLLNGLLGEKVGRKAVYVFFMGIAGTASLFFGFARTPILMVIFACLMSFFGTGAFPSLKMSYAEQYPTHLRTTGAATVETIGRFFGGVVGSFAMPVILSTSGLTVGTWVIAIIAFATLMVELVMSPETKELTLEQLEVVLTHAK